MRPLHGLLIDLRLQSMKHILLSNLLYRFRVKSVSCVIGRICNACTIRNILNGCHFMGII